MVQLDIISGFLGAGKTTFVNMLLDFYLAEGERPAYIANEYGEAGLDSKIVEQGGFEAVELTNGCICCTLRGEITRTVLELIEKFKPTRIVFEPSGVFKFDSFLELLEKGELGEKCKLGNIITVIDGVNYESARIVYGNFIFNQIENAPILFISKLDREGAEANLSEIVCDIKNINHNALIVTKPYAQITHEYLREILSQPCGCGKHHGHGADCGCKHDHEEHEACGCAGGHAHGQDCDCGHEQHAHIHTHKQPLLHEELDTLSVVVNKDFMQAEIDNLAEEIKNGDYGEVIRAKGIIMREGKYVLLNVSFDDLECKPFPCMDEPKMTFIGKKLNRLAIAGALQSGE